MAGHAAFTSVDTSEAESPPSLLHLADLEYEDANRVKAASENGPFDESLFLYLHRKQKHNPQRRR